MEDWTKRFALAALAGFFVFVFAVPVSCGGFTLYNEHVYGDVQSGGPEALLKALGVSAGLAVLVGWVVWQRLRAR